MLWVPGVTGDVDEQVLGRWEAHRSYHSPIQRESLLHPSKIPYDRERRQNHTTKTPRLHLALLIQSLVYAFLVREQSSDGFNGALNAVLGAFHQFFF